MPFTLKVRNYRSLRHVEWSPKGVCAIVGPNGSGKTTLVDVLQFLRDAYLTDVTQAISGHGGLSLLKTRGVPQKEPTSFLLSVGDAVWRLDLETPSSGFESYEEVTLWQGKTINSTSDLFAYRPQDRRIFLRKVKESAGGEVADSAEPLVQVLARYRFHRDYVLNELRRTGSGAGQDTSLWSNGANLFTVLGNWNNVTRERSKRYDFVMRWMREALPDVFDGLDTVPVAGIVAGQVISPAFKEAIPTPLISDGTLVLLLHLTAIASTDEGGVIAIDEPENALHPFAIRKLIEAAREWSAMYDVTILLATHSPVVLDCFKDRPGQIYVMQPGAEIQPVALDKIKKPSWLAHFSLGDLYEKLEFGAPPGAEED